MLTTLPEIKGLVTDLKIAAGHADAVIAVRINHRLRTTMGRAKVDRHGNMSVEFNPRLFARATVEERRQTIAHEVAHIVDFIENGHMKGHGKPWQRIMYRLGFTPDRCHQVSVSGIRTRQERITVECPGACGWETRMAKSTHTRWRNKITRGTHRARCPKCGASFNAEHFGGTPIVDAPGRFKFHQPVETPEERRMRLDRELAERIRRSRLHG